MPARRALVRLIVVLALLLGGCTDLFYFPAQRSFGVPAQPYRPVRIPTRDGLVLSGWLFPARGEMRGTIVQFHGNAGNITSHFRSLAWVTEFGYALLTFDYRGYGRSPGVPTAEGVEEDALAAIAYAERLPRAGAGPDLVLYGQSLGGAVLLHAYARVTARERIRALVVESTFHSYEEVSASFLYSRPLLFPFTGFAYACVSDRYAPAGAIARVAPTPLLVIHGDRDPIVPLAFGRAVYRLAHEPRELWVVHGGRHVDSMRRPEYRARLMSYLSEPD